MPIEKKITTANGERRAGKGKSGQFEQHETKVHVGALVLAAGFSRRFGGTKLASTLNNGRTVLQQTLLTIYRAIPDILVVTRPDLASLLADQPVDIELFDDSVQGMGTTLAHGMQTIIGQQSHSTDSGNPTDDCAAGIPWDACMVCLGDMPFIRPETYVAVSQAARPGSIVVPFHGDRPGNPAVFDRQYFAALARLNGDQGGRRIIENNPGAVIRLELDDPAILQDIDTPADLQRFDHTES